MYDVATTLLMLYEVSDSDVVPPPETGFLVYETLDNIIDNNGFPILYTV